MRKRSNEGSLQNVVAAYLLSIVQPVVRGVGKITGGHVQAFKHKTLGESVEGEVIAKSGDVLHSFKIDISLDGLNLVGVVAYSSMSRGGQRAREQSKAFDLSASANPSGFISAMVDFCKDQFQGHAAPANVSWTLAG